MLISRAKHFDRPTSRPAGVTSVSLKIDGPRIGIIQFNATLHFWQIPQFCWYRLAWFYGINLYLITEVQI